MAYRTTQRVLQRKERTRLAILEAAARLVSEGRPILMEAVAAGAGVSVGSLYSYFKDRADLVLALFQHRADIELAAMREVLEESADSAMALAHAAVTALRRARKNPGMTLFLLLERMDRDERLEAAKLAFHRHHCEAMAEKIRAAIALGRLPPQNADVTAAAALGAMIEIVVRALSQRDPSGSAYASARVDPLARIAPVLLERELARLMVTLCGAANSPSIPCEVMS